MSCDSIIIQPSFGLYRPVVIRVASTMGKNSRRGVDKRLETKLRVTARKPNSGKCLNTVELRNCILSCKIERDLKLESPC